MTDPAKVLLRNASYDGQLTRTLAAAMAGSADLGEAMATARRIGKPSGTAWYDAWSKTADQARQTAEKTRASGERAGARRGYLRASEYYRQAFERDNRSLHVLQRQSDGTWPVVSEIYMDANRDQSYAGHS